MATEILVNIKKRLSEKIQIVAELRLPVDPSWTVVFGPSGAGKSTILRIIAGLDNSDKGTVRFDGETWEDTAAEVFIAPQKRDVGFLFQDFALFPHMTVEKNIVYNLDLPEKEKEEKLRNLINLFDLKGLEKRKPDSLSGGEKQKVAIARTVIRTPKLLLLDEPLSALDLPTREALQKELKRALKTLGIPTIFVTHDRTEAIVMGDRIVVMDGGRIVQKGEVSDVFTKPVDPSVAAIVGMENVLIGEIYDRSEGLVNIKVENNRLVAVDTGVVGPKIAICIRAEEIILEKGSLPESSARNRFVGEVADISDQGVTVKLTLDCGFPLVVLITKRSFLDMSIKVGVSLIASIKAQGIHIFQHD